MLPPDTVLQNRYQIIRAIGRGGMGTVYQATDRRLHNVVALKETSFASEEHLRRAFEREATLLASLRHSALPKVIDHFSEDEGQFLVMEYIAGEDLGLLLERRGGPFPAEEVLGWADQLLDALEHLHSQTPPVIHRDIKPQNLKLTGKGQIILLDFGLAKGSLSQMTQVQANVSVLGYTPNYAPLEQIQGGGTDGRSDLYALAATLYHLLTNKKPPDSLARAGAVLGGQPDPLRPAHELNPQVPLAVSAALMHALAQNRDGRFQSAAQMRQALRDAARAAQRTPTHVNQQSATMPGPVDPRIHQSNPSFGQGTSGQRYTQPPFSQPTLVPHFLQQPQQSKSYALYWIFGGVAIVGLLIAVSVGGFAICRNVGGCGAVPDPTPSPTASPTPRASPSPVASNLENTAWEGTDSDGDYFRFDLLPGGRLQLTPSDGQIRTGTWRVSGNNITMTASGLTWRGTVSANAMSGNGSSQGGHTWTWSLTRAQ